jgi:hypothetical protein
LIVLGARRIRRKPLAQQDRTLLWLVAACLLCIVVWCLVIFTPGKTQVYQGSQVWLLILIAAPQVWLARAHPQVAGVLVALEAAVFLWQYIPTAEPAATQINALAVIIGLIGLAIVAASATVVYGRQRRLVAHPLLSESAPLSSNP